MDGETAKSSESLFSTPLIDTVRRRGLTADRAATDIGYDVSRVHVYEECAERDCLPVIPPRQTPGVKRGDARPPSCSHGTWSGWLRSTFVAP